MAHWFHRNPLKATVLVKFEALQKSSKGDKCKEIITYVIPICVYLLLYITYGHLLTVN